MLSIHTFLNMYLLLALAVLHHTGCYAIEESKCLSNFDYEHKLLYKLIKIEEEVKSFRIFIDNLKVSQIQAENEQKQKLEKVLDDFRNTADVKLQETAEKSGKVLKRIEDSLEYFNETFQNVQKHKMEESMGNLNTTVSKLHQGSAIGFSVKNPAAGPGFKEITFSNVITNLGNSFDKTTGRFTCQTPGYYYFSIALLKEYTHTSIRSTNCFLYKNSQQVVRAYTRPGHTPRNGEYSAVNSVFIHLDTGDTVRLAGCSELSSFDEDSSFSGFFVTADSIQYP